MKKFITVTALISALAITAPALAQSQNDEDIKSDVQAVDKDNTAIHKDREKLAHHRAAKAQDKASESYGAQAVDSLKIGADKTAIEEKKEEKMVDKKILRHHKKEATQDMGDADTSINKGSSY